MLVAGAVEIDGGKLRRARLKVIEGFGRPELHFFVLGAVASQTPRRRCMTVSAMSCVRLPRGFRRSDEWLRSEASLTMVGIGLRPR
jgi:hypothetical protein